MFEKYSKRIIKKLTPFKIRRFLKPYYLKARYFGFKYQCSICNSSLKSLFPGGLSFAVIKEKKIIGAGYNENLFCPICLSSDRDRLVYLYLRHKTDIFVTSVKLLNVAPEVSLQKIFEESRNIDYTSVDLNSPLAQIKMDITDIKMNDETFDIIICNHVLEHITEDLKAMKELFRVLRPGGWAMLQVPISYEMNTTYGDPNIINPEDREREFGQSDHVRIYGRDYITRLKSVGFEVTTYSFLEEFGESLTFKYALNPIERLFICKKTHR